MTRERGVEGSTGPSLQLGTTLLAMLVIATALLLGGAVMLFVLAAELTSELENDQRGRAADVADVVAEQGPMALAGSAHRPVLSEGLVQVVGSDGAVVWTSDPSRGKPVADLRLGDGQTGGQTELSLFGAEVGSTVGARGVSHQGTSYTVLAVGSTRPADVALRRDALSLLVLVPVLTGLGGVATWTGVRRTLRPVEQIRTTAESISWQELDARVAEPEGNDEVARLARTLNDMLDRLDDAHLSQRRFIADAGHELRSPVATLRAGLEILGQRPSELAELLPVLSAETQRLGRLTDDLLLLARSDAGELVRPTHDVDLDDLVSGEVRRLLSSSEVQVSARLSPVRVVGDAELLARLVRNLMENATAACRGRIAVSLACSDGTAVLRVDDDGPGIPAGERRRIFDRFVRLDEARNRQPGGAGLGLAIVAAAAAAHGGQVVVGESAWGGARFEVQLPVLPGGGAQLSSR